MLICTPGPVIGQLRCLQLGHLRGEDRRRRRAQRGRRRRQEPQRGRQGGRRGQVLLAPCHTLLREFYETGLAFNSIVKDSRLLKAHVPTAKICLLLLLNLL